MSAAATAAAKPRHRSKPRPRDRSPGILTDPPASLFPSKDDLLTLLAVAAIAAAVAVACNSLTAALTRRPRPFCDGSDGVGDSPDLCDPCPDNGLCSNGNLKCIHGYKKHGRICVEDGEIDQVANKLAERTKQHVCDSYARVLCDETGKIWFQESDIFEVLDEFKLNEDIGLKDDTYRLAKNRLLEILDSLLENTAVPNGTTEFKCPDELAKIHRPFRCCIRQWMYQHFLLILALISLLVGLAKMILISRRKYYLSKRAEQLYAEVCEILEDNAMIAKSQSSEGEPWVVASWLRDHLLLPKERKDTKLWKKVEELLLEDSRIDQYPKLIKGESKIVLEWQVDGPLSLKMRSKRAASKARYRSDAGPSCSQERKLNFAEPQHA